MKIEELSEEYEAAFLVMIEDFMGQDPVSCEEFFGRKQWNAHAYHRFLLECRKQRQDWRPKAKSVSLTHYFLFDDSQPEIFGYGRMRFPMDQVAETDGGNLEVTIAPSRRRSGNGSVCLNLMLFEAVRAGLRRALVICRADDPASRIIIERNRGVLQDVVASKHPLRKGTPMARYWISFR